MQQATDPTATDDVSERNRKSEETMANRVLSIAVAAALGLTLAGCTPTGAAVGDTQTVTASPAHDSVQGARITVALIGTQSNNATETATDSAIAKALTAYGMAPIYTSLQGVAHPDAVAQQAVSDAVYRHMQAIMISNLMLTDANQDSWTTALETAREGGVAVILVAPTDVPENSDLYAAVLTVHDADSDNSTVEPIATAVNTIVRDEPHDRNITVTTDIAANTKLNGYS